MPTTASDNSMNVTPSHVPVTGSWHVTGEALRYLVSSFFALAVDASLLSIGVRGLSIAPWLAGGVAYGTGLVLIYFLSVRWVFAERAVPDRRGEFILFAVLGIIGLVLNSLTLFVTTDLGMALPTSKAISAALGFVANFVSRKLLLFS